MEHTPWTIGRDENNLPSILDSFGDPVGWVEEDVIERCVAAVNATAGISTSALESGAVAEMVENVRAYLDSYLNTPFCPVCCERVSAGHLIDCPRGQLAAALAKLQAPAEEAKP